MAYCKVEREEQFTIVPNELMRDERLTLKAKGLQALVLTLPPKWDMTIEGLATICIECSDTISAILKELEAAGYLSRYRERHENGRYGQMLYTFYRKPLHKKPIGKKPVRNNSGRDISGQLSKELSSKEELNKDSSNIPSINQADTIDEIETYRKILYENIDYEVLKEQDSRGILDEIAELMLECICSTSPTIRVGKEDVPQELVKSRFLKIDSSHIEYVMMCLEKNTTKVRNIKAYIKTALYNAPLTINSFYTAEVNHDLYGTD